MARLSNILKYPPELLAYLHQCLDDPKLTQAQTLLLINERIADKYLNEKDLTAGALGRYAKKRRESFEAALDRMAQLKAQREEFAERFGDDNLDTAGRYMMEMLMPVVGELITALTLIRDATPEQALDYSKTVKNLGGTIATIEKALSESRQRNAAIQKAAVDAAVDAMENQADKMNQDENVTVALRKAIMDGLKNG